MLDTLVGMHTHSRMRVKLQGHLGDPFDSTCGVRQGDPLSPLLFGLYIDRLEAFLRARKPNIGCTIASTLLQALLYADDVVLFADSADDLQELLACLGDFCAAHLLTVNVPKSEVVVFNSCFVSHTRQHELRFAWHMHGMPLARSSKFPYLGVLFEDGAHMQLALDRGVDKGKAALFAMMRRCYELGVHNVALQCHLFSTLVQPVLLYGSEVWGAYHFAKIASPQFMYGLRGPTEQLQLMFLRQSLGVFTSTPVAPMLHETGRRPLVHSMVSRVLEFWNKLAACPAQDIARIALMDSIRMAVEGKQSWAKAVLQGYGPLTSSATRP